VSSINGVVLVLLIIATLLVLLLGMVVAWTLRKVERVQESMGKLIAELERTSAELKKVTAEANAEVSRANATLGTARSLSHTVDTATQFAYKAVANPLVKTLAVSAGTGSAFKKWRSREGKSRGRER